MRIRIGRETGIRSDNVPADELLRYVHIGVQLGRQRRNPDNGFYAKRFRSESTCGQKNRFITYNNALSSFMLFDFLIVHHVRQNKI